MRPAVPKRLDIVSNGRIGFPPQPKAAIHVKTKRREFAESMKLSGTGAQPTQGGPGFGPGNNPGVDGSAYGRSTASDASGGRSDSRGPSSNFGSEEVAVETAADHGKGKGRSEEERGATGGMRVLTRISSETGVSVDTLQTQKTATGLGYGDLETANLLAKASSQSFDSIVAKFKVARAGAK